MPSYVAANATAFDIMIDDVYNSWLEYKTRAPSEAPRVDQTQLENIMKRHQEKMRKTQ